jgi:hypothetical protein
LLLPLFKGAGDDGFWTGHDVEIAEDEDGGRPTTRSFSILPIGLNHGKPSNYQSNQSSSSHPFLGECKHCYRTILYSNPNRAEKLVSFDGGCKFCSKLPFKMNNVLNLNLLMLDVLKDWVDGAKTNPLITIGFCEYGEAKKTDEESDTNFNPFSFNNPSAAGQSPGNMTITPVTNDSNANNTAAASNPSFMYRPVFIVLQGSSLYVYDLVNQSGKQKYRVRQLRLLTANQFI